MDEGKAKGVAAVENIIVIHVDDVEVNEEASGSPAFPVTLNRTESS